MLRSVAVLCVAIAFAGNGQAAFLARVHEHHHEQHHEQHAHQKYHPMAELCPFGYGCGGGGGQLTQATKDQVANILKGIISNLGKKKGLTQISADLNKVYGLHQAKNNEVKKALLGLLKAFQKDKVATATVVNKLTGEPTENLASLAAVSRVLSKTTPFQDPVGVSPRTKWQLLKSGEF